MPPELRTAVVVPTLFGSVDAVREALENLEVQFLANREAHLHFAVLSDFTDSPDRDPRGRRRDPRGRRRGRARAERPLRRRPGRRVLSLPPPAPWNPQRGRLDGVGAEARQAGRVQPVPARQGDGRLLARSSATSSRSQSVRYVITLDSDTVLPPDAAPLLVGTLAHPLNRAVYDPHARPRGARLRHPPAARRRLAAQRATARSSRRSTPVTRASIRTRPRSPTSIRTSTARGASPARGSTTSTPSSRRRTAASPRTRCSRTT